jgi:hypothetical protein
LKPASGAGIVLRNALALEIECSEIALADRVAAGGRQ